MTTPTPRLRQGSPAVGSWPENKDGMGEGTLLLQLCPSQVLQVPQDPTPSLGSASRNQAILLPRETLSHRISPWMALEEPPHLHPGHTGPSLLRVPHLSQSMHPSPSQGPPTPTQGAQRPIAHTPCRARSSSAALGGRSPANVSDSPTPGSALRSQPMALLEPLQAELPPTSQLPQPSPLPGSIC